MARLNVVAIIAAYNEEDIVGQAVRALVDEGVKVYFIDHHSTDRTVEEVERYRKKGVIGIEYFPAAANDQGAGTFIWRRILKRKEELAHQLDADWFIHHDADEFRESPWSGETLLDGIERVDRAGYNAIDFQVLNFWPTSIDPEAEPDVRERLRFYEPGQVWDRVQIKCWKNTGQPVDLSESGGHSVEFAGRHVSPIRFLLRHYPIRSQAHGARKVFQERRPRVLDAEAARGWHVQYSNLSEGASFVRDPWSLKRFNAEAVRFNLFANNREVERLESLARSSQETAVRLTDEERPLRAHLARQDAELARLRPEREALLASRDAELQKLQVERERLAVDLEAMTNQLGRQETGLARLRAEREELLTELDRLRALLPLQDLEADRWRRERERLVVELTGARDRLTRKDTTIEYVLASRSWRWTSGLRAADRFVHGRAAESTGRGLALANLPLGRALRLSTDVFGFWADGWAEAQLSFRAAVSRRIDEVIIRGVVPSELVAGQDLRLQIGSQEWTRHAPPGGFEWRVPVSFLPGALAQFQITASCTWRPSTTNASNDQRDLAWYVVGIESR